MFYIRFFIEKMSKWLISSFLVSDVSELLTAQVPQQKWAMWANRSGCSQKMSDHERFTQVAHQKWATMSESLRSLTKNEGISKSLEFFSESLIPTF